MFDILGRLYVWVAETKEHCWEMMATGYKLQNDIEMREEVFNTLESLGEICKLDKGVNYYYCIPNFVIGKVTFKEWEEKIKEIKSQIQ